MAKKFVLRYRQQKGADAKGAFDLWGLATAVADSVKKGTAGIATTVNVTELQPSSP